MIFWQHDNKTYSLPDDFYWKNIDLNEVDFLNKVMTTFNYTELNNSFKMKLGRDLNEPSIEIEGEEITLSDVPEELEEFFDGDLD